MRYAFLRSIEFFALAVSLLPSFFPLTPLTLPPPILFPSFPYLQPVNTNGIDDLRSIFISSQITFTDSVDQVLSACPDFNLSAKDSESGVSLGIIRAKVRDG